MPTYPEDDNKPSLKEWKEEPGSAKDKAGKPSFLRRHIDKSENHEDNDKGKPAGRTS